MKEAKKQEDQNKVRLRLIKICSHFERLEKAGLIYVDNECSKVVIDNTLAALFIQSAEKWKAFLQNLEFYVVFKLSSYRAMNQSDQAFPINKKAVHNLPTMNFVILNKSGDPIVVGNFKSGKLDMVPYEIIAGK